MVDGNLADPVFEPADEQLGERFKRAFADVDGKHCGPSARSRSAWGTIGCGVGPDLFTLPGRAPTSW